MWKKYCNYFWIILLIFLVGCNDSENSAPIGYDSTQTGIIQQLVSETSTIIPQAPPSLTSTFIPTTTKLSSSTITMIPNPTSTLTSTPTMTPTVTPTPIYEILRGEVNVEHVMCFYGPSKAYLYKYGLLGGSNLEILGIMSNTSYIQVRAIGGDNPCWMNLEWMNVKGDISSLKPIDPFSLDLPQSPYYGPLTSISATRQGNMVTISWSPLILRAGDDSEQEPYLVETWVCQSNTLRFIPYGLYETTLTVEDQSECNEPSHGRVYGVEKHGYTLPVEIPWP